MHFKVIFKIYFFIDFSFSKIFFRVERLELILLQKAIPIASSPPENIVFYFDKLFGNLFYEKVFIIL